MRTSKVRSYRNKKRPHLKFVVNFKRNGKRARSFFETKKAAQTFAQLKNNERLIGETEGAKQLAEFGKTIADAIAFYLPHLQAKQNRKCTFAELVAELLTGEGGRRRQRGLPHGFEMPAWTIREQLRRTGWCPKSDADEIDDWLRGLNVSPVTRNNSRRVLRTAFSFARGAQLLRRQSRSQKPPKQKRSKGRLGF